MRKPACKTDNYFLGKGKTELVATATPPTQDRRVKINASVCCRLFLASCFTCALAWYTSAQGPAPTPLFSPAPVMPPAAPMPELALARELTRPDLEAFLDALIPAQLQNRDMAGAVIAVVKDGQVLLA